MMQADTWQIVAEAREQDLTLAERRRPVWPNVFMAFYGAGWAFAFDVGVRLYGAEICMALSMLLIRWRPVIQNYPMLRRVLAAYALWVVAIALSDVVNGTAFFDSIRNMSTPILGGASLVLVVAVLARAPNALLTFLIFTVIAKGILGEASYGDKFAEETLSLDSIQENTNLFKVRIEPFLTPLMLLLGAWFGKKNLSISALFFLMAGIGYLVFDVRSSALVFLISSLILFWMHWGIRPRGAVMAGAALFLVLIGYGAYLGYVNYTLTYNPYGHNGQMLRLMDNPYNPLAALQYGRPEWLVMPSAISERPLFGWGSWAQDPGLRFSYLRAERMGSDIYLPRVGTSGTVYIPAHSLIGTSWVWSGLLGFMAMVWFLRSVWRMSLCLRGSGSDLLPVVVFLTILLFWHFFFSPPMVVRLSYPVTLAALIVLTRNSFSYAPSRV